MGVFFQLPRDQLWGPESDENPKEVKRSQWQVGYAPAGDELQESFRKEPFMMADIQAASSSSGGTWVPQKELLKRQQRLPPNSPVGEQPWTNVDNWGTECTSAACTIVGFAVGYQGLVGFNKTTTASRKDNGFVGFDPSLEPPLARPPPNGTWEDAELRRG